MIRNVAVKRGKQKPGNKLYPLPSDKHRIYEKEDLNFAAERIKHFNKLWQTN